MWGAEWKKGYDRKEEREGKVMIMTNYYCDAQQQSKVRRGEARRQPQQQQPVEVHSTYTHLFVSLSVEVVLLIDPSIYRDQPAGPAEEDHHVLFFCTSCVSSVYCTCLPG